MSQKGVYPDEFMDSFENSIKQNCQKNNNFTAF